METNATYLVIAADGPQYGFITESELRVWIQERRVGGQNQAWLQGSPDWKPLADHASFRGLFPPSPPAAPPRPLLHAAPPIAPARVTPRGQAPLTQPSPQKSNIRPKLVRFILGTLGAICLIAAAIYDFHEQAQKREEAKLRADYEKLMKPKTESSRQQAEVSQKRLQERTFDTQEMSFLKNNNWRAAILRFQEEPLVVSETSIEEVTKNGPAMRATIGKVCRFSGEVSEIMPMPQNAGMDGAWTGLVLLY